MNIAEFSIKKKVITLTLIVLILVGGITAFGQLSRLEDPEFTIKEAVVYTPWPGASAREVERDVSNVIEKACQELGQLEYVKSQSKRGLSVIKVRIKDKYDKYTLPQVWDELRRKVTDYQVQLPPGAGPSIVNDDFGDVYGVFIAITGEGYTYADLWDYVDLLQRELLSCTDVKRIIVYGKQPEVVYVEMNRNKMSQLGISQQDIYEALRAKNIPADSGWLTLGGERLPINPTGEFTSEKQFGELLISPPGSPTLVYLKDVATITRGYKEPPNTILRANQQPAVGLAISTVLGGNVVTMGESLQEKFTELLPLAPLGMEAELIAVQSDAVTKAINSFLINLIEAVIIVIVVLLIFMGLRSGLIIGFILFLTICGSFIFMDMWNIILERISLGALIIALGMLVDNAIVVTDGMKVKMEQGTDALTAAKEVVGQTAVPLLGATAVAIIAFAAIGTSQDSTGEYCRSLFQVILISLGLSWVTAVTATPLLCKMFLKTKPKADPNPDAKPKDPYGGKIYQFYKQSLLTCLRHRWVTLAVVGVLFLVALFGFSFVKSSFFPDSTRPQFFIDFWFREGTDIKEVERRLEKAEEYLMGLDGVTSVATELGGGQPRFLLTYTPESASWSYGQIIVSVDDYKKIAKMRMQAQQDLENLLPDAIVITKEFRLGPGEGGRIQLRISGPDHEMVREMATKAKNIMLDDPHAMGVRDDWRDKVKVIRPQLAEAQARRLGIDRPDVCRTLEAAYFGTKTGVYREDEELLDITARAPLEERINVDSINDIVIWSPAEKRMIPLRQIVTGFNTEYEDANIWRRNRKPTITIHADPREGFPSELLERIKPKIEKALNVDVGAVLDKKFRKPEDVFKNFNDKTVPIKYNTPRLIKGMPGYSLAWGGEAEDSTKAQAALATSIPVFGVMMILIVICLFNAIRQPLIIWLCVPLAIIGVTAGLLLFNQPFGFMPLLGLLSLSGMLIKNAIVLIDQIDLEIKEGKEKFLAIVDSGMTRMRPVALAAITTIFGMTPLLQDAFFISMAVTIMVGLAFATILTLVIVPVLYAVFFKVPYREIA